MEENKTLEFIQNKFIEIIDDQYNDYTYSVYDFQALNGFRFIIKDEIKTLYPDIYVTDLGNRIIISTSDVFVSVFYDCIDDSINYLIKILFDKTISDAKNPVEPIKHFINKYIGLSEFYVSSFIHEGGNEVKETYSLKRLYGLKLKPLIIYSKNSDTETEKVRIIIQ